MLVGEWQGKGGIGLWSVLNAQLRLSDDFHILVVRKYGITS